MVKKDFRDQAIKKEERKHKARQEKEISVWGGFSLFGLVGWTVILPALLGIFLGIGVEHYFTGTHSWTLALLLGGIFVGCAIALRILERELFKKDDE